MCTYVGASATPTLLNLNTMKGADGKPLNIIKEISAKDYMTFGMCILQDENGTAVDLIKKDHIQDGAKSVTRAILQQWLASTAAPRTYQHLIESLRLTDGLDGLASSLKKRCSNFNSKVRCTADCYYYVALYFFLLNRSFTEDDVIAHSRVKTKD